jgi:hypothetical protein
VKRRKRLGNKWLSYVMRTTKGKDSHETLYERFTTKGIAKEALPFVSFASRYCLNYIEHTGYGSSSAHAKVMLHNFRRSDLVRCTGIRYHLDVSIKPKSGFKLRVLMFQSVKGWDDINNELYNEDSDDVHVGDGEAYESQVGDKKGGFNLQGAWFTKIRNNQNGTEAVIHPAYAGLFPWQKKTYDHLDFNQTLHRLRITHPDVKMIYNKQYVVMNRMKIMKRKNIQEFYCTSTTWRYRPLVHDGLVDKLADNNKPDRKVWWMVIVTPIWGGVDDPGQDMYGASDLDKPLPDLNDRRHHSVAHQGSIVDERFGEAVVKREATEGTLDYVDPPQNVDMALPGPADGPDRMSTRSMTAAAEGSVDPQQGMIDALSGIRDEDEEVRHYLRAMEINRRIVAAERALKPPKPPRMSKTPKPPKAPKPPTLETNEYGWAYDQTIMFRPTFSVNFYNENKQRGVRW